MDVAELQLHIKEVEDQLEADPNNNDLEELLLTLKEGIEVAKQLQKVAAEPEKEREKKSLKTVELIESESEGRSFEESRQELL
jgi:hypothetical protein